MSAARALSGNTVFSCVPNQFIFNGAGGGNRTIRAYSFYVTYCKHTNARTAQPAVCPPPMYKIMYNEIGRCGTTFALSATLLLSPFGAVLSRTSPGCPQTYFPSIQFA
jgi:hypothetical protein